MAAVFVVGCRHARSGSTAPEPEQLVGRSRANAVPEVVWESGRGVAVEAGGEVVLLSRLKILGSNSQSG